VLEMRWILVGCGGGSLRSRRGVRLYYNGGMVWGMVESSGGDGGRLVYGS
jgi:hypothetical protein